MATTADIGVPGQPMNNPPLTPWQAAVRDAVPPVGAVIAFGGSVAPPGWHLCDGTAHGSAALQAVTGSANTPNLRDRFIVGAGTTYAVGATGGEATHVLTTAEMPAHTHGVKQKFGPAGMEHMGADGWASQGGASGTDAAAFPTNTTGGGAAHENRPPYYALTYIIRKQP